MYATTVVLSLMHLDTCILVDDGISANSPSLLASPEWCMGLAYTEKIENRTSCGEYHS